MPSLLQICVISVGACLSAQAQWVNHPTAGVPRTSEGKVNLTAPAPRVNGKPDLSGVWQVEPSGNGFGFNGLGEPSRSKYNGNILADFKANEAPLQPEAAAVLAKTVDTDSPGLNCVPYGVPGDLVIPHPFKILQAPGVMMILYEVDSTFRQIFTDGREQLKDPQPSWMGYSVGKWDDDTLVIDTVGFNDLGWLDARGHRHSSALHTVKRFYRRDVGHMDVELTLEDSKTFTKPVTVKFVEELLPDTDLIEHFCAEDEKDVEHMKAGRKK
jgi:hypothetical protein